MRQFLLAAVMFGAVSTAHAADLPFLRGGFSDGLSRSSTNWQGFYAGGQGGLGTSDMDFTNTTAAEVQRLLFGTALLADGQLDTWKMGTPVSVHGHGYGGFAGYNWQWDDIVVGIELNYMHGKFLASQSNSSTRAFTDGSGALNNLTYVATSSAKLVDTGSIRGRAAWSAGIFLPYAFGGVALGQADIIRSVNVFGTQTFASSTPPIVVPFNLFTSDGQNSKYITGYVGGVGMDIMLVSCLFLRAEWEYAHYNSSVPITVNTARFGLGYKF